MSDLIHTSLFKMCASVGPCPGGLQDHFLYFFFWGEWLQAWKVDMEKLENEMGLGCMM